jgi:hypothetical protein
MIDAALRAFVRRRAGRRCEYCRLHDQSCPYSDCSRPIRDLLAEMVPNAYQRHSRSKMERRAKDYGSQKNPPDATMAPEQWVAEEKLMAGALCGHQYVEDGTP